MLDRCYWLGEIEDMVAYFFYSAKKSNCWVGFVGDWGDWWGWGWNGWRWSWGLIVEAR